MNIAHSPSQHVVPFIYSLLPSELHTNQRVLAEPWWCASSGTTVNRLRRDAIRSLEELIAALEKHVAAHNREPKPFILTAKADDILENISRAKSALLV